MTSFELPALPHLLLGFAALWLFVDGIALSLGARWAYRFGIPLPWRYETHDAPLPREPLDPGDELDREHSFDTDDYHSAFYLDRDTVGLLYWGARFGGRNTIGIRPLRGLGVVATGLLEIGRGPVSAGLRWRPVVRLPPLALLAALSLVMRDFMAGAFTGASAFEPPLFIMGVWALFYLGVLWWTLRKLPVLYDSISAQIVARAHGYGG